MSRRLALAAAAASTLAFTLIAVLALLRGGTLSSPAPGPEEPGPRLPVLLVPGWADEGDRLAPLAHQLRTRGWGDTSVHLLRFDDPVDSNIRHSQEIREAVDTLRRRTGAERVDIVAHSMGGLAARWYLQHGGASEVRRLVTLGSPHRGTLTSLAAWGDGGKEMKPESDFLAALDPGLPEGIEGLTIRTELETHIIPPESATLPGVPDTVVCCAMHWTLPADATTIEIILDFLLHGRAS
ncbi:MAG: alpha/beta fold hydrolase [Longimicrobiales bacterium]|nr:alpha/beta fold hydrolase [Longimicrobiales bacterium]